MGCHVWFYRPMTDAEFQDMKSKAYEHAAQTMKKSVHYGWQSQMEADAFLSEFKKSLDKNLPCIYGDSYWYEFGYGCKPLETTLIKGKIYVYVNDFHDIGRCIFTYPRKVIYSYKQFKRYVGKKWYTDVSESDKKKLSEFFQLYPGGCIQFG